ncbi:MAG TPA: hypothetical protein VHB97_01915 [Polyangia bacterium]|jgi:hypothetical protein|nr:hypothetical protein [Polyangia bacterium]
MRIFGFGVILMIAFAVLGIDVGESWRLGAITDGDAHAKRHHRKHHKRARHRHHKRHRAPATEM